MVSSLVPYLNAPRDAITSKNLPMEILTEVMFFGVILLVNQTLEIKEQCDNAAPDIVNNTIYVDSAISI